jgi:hypothetical protein
MWLRSAASITTGPRQPSLVLDERADAVDVDGGIRAGVNVTHRKFASVRLANSGVVDEDD